jgi:predicted ATPase
MLEKKIYINNCKCLVDVKLPLTPIHVIIGPNDSGKTSLLEAIFALFRSTEKQLVEAFPGDWQDRGLVFAGAETPAIQFEADFVAANGNVRSPLTYHLEVEPPPVLKRDDQDRRRDPRSECDSDAMPTELRAVRRRGCRADQAHI